jgi:hypothetical protein
MCDVVPGGGVQDGGATLEIVLAAVPSLTSLSLRRPGLRYELARPGQA